MTVLSNFISCWSKRYNQTKYPKMFYLNLLRQIENVRTPQDLGRALELLIHWKDAKIRKDPNGDLLLDGVFYSVSKPKPNTYSKESHGQILESQQFYEWAKEIRHTKSFSLDAMVVIRERFNLWSSNSVVLPAFTLHALSPRVFPIFDQHVDRARRCFTGELFLGSVVRKRGLNDQDYLEYQEFWMNLLAGLAIRVDSADYADIKAIDDAIWAFGASLKSLESSGGRRETAKSSDIKQPPGKAPTAGHYPVRTAYTLAKNKEFEYEGSVKNGVTLRYTGRPFIRPKFFYAILRHFSGEKVQGGFNMTAPPSGGLGRWVQDNSSELNGLRLTPRHAAHLAAILVQEGYITCQLEGNAVYLTFPPTTD